MSSVLLVEPYLAGSHQAWAEGYAAASTHDVDVISLPGRFWKWRMFGGSLTLGRMASQRESPDVLLCSDMVDLASFLGHAGTEVASAKTVLYMHENQLTYPLSPTVRDDLAYAYINWSSMVRADEVWFNSRFHLDSVLEALPGFLSHFPDQRHTGIIESVAEKSLVMPVGVDLSWTVDGAKDDPPLIVWNQRWEYDKDPVRLFGALYRLVTTGRPFRLAICGENFRNVPVEFEEARRRLADYSIQFGFADENRYRSLLNQSSVLMSTARHEFFGVAAVEAMAAGAVPVLPNEMSYPELVPRRLHPDTLYESDDELDGLLANALDNGKRRDRIGSTLIREMEKFSWAEVAPRYDEGLAR